MKTECKASSSEEPGAGIPHAGICAGGARQRASLPRYVTVLAAGGNVAPFTLASSLEYDPFGRVVAHRAAPGHEPLAAANRYRFSTKWQDPLTRLSDYGFRWYDAERGRWVSREPKGRPSFNLYLAFQNQPSAIIDRDGRDNFCPPDQTLCCGVCQNYCGVVCSPPDPAPPPTAPDWTVCDAFKRYFSGVGGSVSLGLIGLYDEVTEALQPSMDEYKDIAIQSIKDASSILSCPSPTLTSTMGADSPGANAGVYWIGGISFSRQYFCQAKADCTTCSYSYKCNLDFSMNDPFTDPWDILNLCPGVWDPGGTPFFITGSWSDTATGSGSL